MAAWQTDAWSAGTGRGEPFSSTTSRPVSACANTVASTGRNRARPEGPGAIQAVVSTPVTQRPNAEDWARVMDQRIRSVMTGKTPTARTGS